MSVRHTSGVRFVRGEPDDDDVAAVLAVLSVLGGRAATPPEPEPPAPASGRRPPGAPFVAASAWVHGS